MIDEVVAAVGSAAPLLVDDVAWDDPVLLVGGDGWGLTAFASWRVTGPTGIVTGFADGEASDRVWDLVGSRVVGAGVQSALGGGDVALALSSGWGLEVFSSGEVEPWTLRVPPDHVFVAAPADPSWSGQGSERPAIEAGVNRGPHRSLAHLAASGAAGIESATWDGWCLRVGGPSWGLSVRASWRVLAPPLLRYGYASIDAPAQVEDLVGTAVVAVGEGSTATVGDLVLHLADGRALEVFTAGEDEPSVLRAPGDDGAAPVG